MQKEFYIKAPKTDLVNIAGVTTRRPGSSGMLLSPCLLLIFESTLVWLSLCAHNPQPPVSRKRKLLDTNDNTGDIGTGANQSNSQNDVNTQDRTLGLFNSGPTFKEWIVYCKSEDKYVSRKTFSFDKIVENNAEESVKYEILMALFLTRSKSFPQVQKLHFTKNNLIVEKEYPLGGFLQDMVKNSGTLPPQVIRLWAAQILKGIHFLNHNNLAHTNLTTKSVMLMTDGIIKIMGSESSVKIGEKVRRISAESIYLSAPELSYEPASDKTDIWNFGLLMHFMCTGQDISLHSSIAPTYPHLLVHKNSPFYGPIFWTIQKNRHFRMDIDSLIRHKLFDGIDWSQIDKEVPHLTGVPVKYLVFQRPASTEHNVQEREVSSERTEALRKRMLEWWNERQSASRINVQRPTTKILGCIGHGGYGIVWLVDSDKAGQVARKALNLKVIVARNRLKSVMMEINASIRLSNHPSFPKTFNVFCDDQNINIDYEVVTGGTMAEFIGAFAPLPSRLTVHIGAQILSALHYLHNNGLVHCDLNTGNVLLTQYGCIKVIDYGFMVRSGGSVRIDPDACLGMMAPEARQGKMTTKADIWSLGIFLYMMAFGKFPFANTDLHHEKVIWHFFTSDSLLEHLIRLCLVKNPNDRPDAAGLKQHQLFKNENIDWQNIATKPLPLQSVTLEISAAIRDHLKKPVKFLQKEEIDTFEQKVAARGTDCSAEELKTMRDKLEKWIHSGYPLDD